MYILLTNPHFFNTGSFQQEFQRLKDEKLNDSATLKMLKPFVAMAVFQESDRIGSKCDWELLDAFKNCDVKNKRKFKDSGPGTFRYESLM